MIKLTFLIHIYIYIDELGLNFNYFLNEHDFGIVPTFWSDIIVCQCQC